MDIRLFNRTYNRYTRKRALAAPRVDGAIATTDINLMGLLDPGCEELGGYPNDVVIAPGVIAHFNTLESPPADYYGLPTFERY